MIKTNNYYELFENVCINQKYKIVIIDKRFYFKMPINYEFESLQIRQIALQNKKKSKIFIEKDYKTETIRRLSSSKEKCLHKPCTNVSYLTFEMNNLMSNPTQNLKDKFKKALASKSELFSKDNIAKRYSFLKFGILHVNNAYYNTLFKKARFKIRRICPRSFNLKVSNESFNESEFSKLKEKKIDGFNANKVSLKISTCLNSDSELNTNQKDLMQQINIKSLEITRFDRKFSIDKQRFNELNVLPSIKETEIKSLHSDYKDNILNQTTSNLKPTELEIINNEKYKNLTKSVTKANR